jgi:hypothetical protein
MARPNLTIPAMVAALFFLGAVTMLPYPKAEAKSKMQKQAFGKIQDGQSVDLYTLSNKYGMTAAISNFGGTLVSLKVPDRDGKIGDVVLGYDNPADYESAPPSAATVTASRTASSLWTVSCTPCR